MYPNDLDGNAAWAEGCYRFHMDRWRDRYDEWKTEPSGPWIEELCTKEERDPDEWLQDHRDKEVDREGGA